MTLRLPWVGLLFVCAFYLLTYHLGDRPFWVDESIASLPARAILEHGVPYSPFDLNFMEFQLKFNVWDPATPLYRYALAIFTYFTGFSEYTARLFSVGFGLVLIPILYSLFRHFGSGSVALGAVVWLVYSPVFFVHAREARHFTFLQVMVFATLLVFVWRVRHGRRRDAWLWMLLLCATLLSQSLGYLILPIAAFGCILFYDKKPFDGSLKLHYLAIVAPWIFVLYFFGDTLPFFHQVNCLNRPEGCQGDAPFYYLKVLLLNAASLPEYRVGYFFSAISFNSILLMVGLLYSLSLWRVVPRRKIEIFAVGVWLIPIVLLSLQEVKFPRYSYLYGFPFCAFFIARGADWLRRVRPLSYAPRTVFLGAIALAIVSPVLHLPNKDIGSTFELRFSAIDSLREELVASRSDNFELMQAQVRFLREKMGPYDQVVSAFDDASLGYYLEHFVYGFFNSQRTDSFFVDLVEKVSAQNGRVWLVDTLPQFYNLCHARAPELMAIDCRIKYARFFEMCSPGSPAYNSACTRVDSTTLRRYSDLARLD